MEVQSKISNHIQAWQTAWQETWNLTEGLSEETLLQKPGLDKWSVQEVIQHLYISESISLDYIKYKLKDVHKVKKSSLMNSLRSLALSVALKSPFKFKAPSVVSSKAMPSGEDWATTRQKMDHLHQQFVDVASAIPPELLSKELFRHPLAGRMTLGEMFSFLKDHNRHHQVQIRRTLTSL